jgi:hypothetical protein
MVYAIRHEGLDLIGKALNTKLLAGNLAPNVSVKSGDIMIGLGMCQLHTLILWKV